MKGCSYGHRSCCFVLVVGTLFLSLNLLLPTISASIYASLSGQSSVPVAPPPVILQPGTAGTSTIYTNNTSAEVSVAAPTPTYDYVLKVVNQMPDSWKIRLAAYSQSNIGRLDNCTIYFRNLSDGTSGQIYIVSGSYTQQTGPWYDLPPSPAERYLAITLQANSSEVSIINVYLEILIPNKTTYAKYILTFEIT